MIIYSSIFESVNIPIGNRDYFNIADYNSIIQSKITYKTSPILIGPGLGNKNSTVQLVSKLLRYFKNKKNNCILDASGFEPLYNSFDIKDLPKNCILTPHLGEFQKIFPKIDISNPIDACKKIVNILDNILNVLVLIISPIRKLQF